MTDTELKPCDMPPEVGENLLDFLRDVYDQKTIPESSDVDHLLMLVKPYLDSELQKQREACNALTKENNLLRLIMSEGSHTMKGQEYIRELGKY